MCRRIWYAGLLPNNIYIENLVFLYLFIKLEGATFYIPFAVLSLAVLIRNWQPSLGIDLNIGIKISFHIK